MNEDSQLKRMAWSAAFCFVNTAGVELAKWALEAFKNRKRLPRDSSGAYIIE